jgi:HEAT repeat protein
VALGGAAPPTPENREIPSERGSLKLKDDVFKRLFLELKDTGRDFKERAQIAGLFAYFREARAVPELVAIVQSPNERMELKTACLWALGEIGHPLGMPAFQYALNQIYTKDPDWTQAKGMTEEVDGKERELSLRELCESRLGRLAEPVLLKQKTDERAGFVDVLLAPLVKGKTPDKPPEDDEETGRLRAALICVAAVGDRSATALKALTDVLTADDNYYPWDFKVIAAEALSSILVRRSEEMKAIKDLRPRDKLADQVAAAFIEAFGVTDIPEVREVGGPALRRTGWADRAAKSLITVLKTPNLPKRVHYRAIEALAYLESKEAADHLIFLLFDRDPNIRWRAAVSLGTTGDQRAADFLRKLTKDDDVFVRVKAVAALGHLRSAAVLPDLAVAVSDPDSRVRRQAVLAIGRLGLRQGIPVLVKRGLKDSSPSVRALSIIALGYIARPEGIEAVSPMLDDTVTSVRRSAVQVLERFPSSTTTKALVPALGDSDDLVRADALRVMGDRIQANPKGTIALLADAIANSKGRSRLGAIQCIAADYLKARQSKDSKLRPLYDRLLNGPQATLAAALIAALADPDPKARAAAGTLLAKHGWGVRNKDLLTAAVALTADKDPEVRKVGLMARNFLNNLR